MRKEFDKLKSELWEGSTTDKNGDNNWYLISELLNNLENKIKEVEGRIEVTKKISSEINNTISKFTTFVDEGKVFKMNVSRSSLYQQILTPPNDSYFLGFLLHHQQHSFLDHLSVQQ